jgi:hypothetical protein
LPSDYWEVTLLDGAGFGKFKRRQIRQTAIAAELGASFTR